ncbi:MAG TPA: hypothetical protein VHX65_16165 [Pirellulales bacterium]|jgi:hypothetical protein|nr:hypothetical protein [Pirellulales bacterium]
MAFDEGKRNAIYRLGRLGFSTAISPRDEVTMIRPVYTPSIGDDGVEIVVNYLLTIGTIREASFCRTRITDAALPIIAKLTSVEVLRIIHTNATAEGLKHLQARLPNCRLET